MKKWLLILCLLISIGGLGACQRRALQTAQVDTPPASDDPIPAPAPDPRAEVIQRYLDEMTLAQKAGQLFLARCPAGEEAAQAGQYQPGGYVLFSRDFASRTPDSLRAMLEECRAATAIPMLFSVDEEGGTVCRISRYPQYRADKFPSPQALDRAGGLEAVLADTKEKAALLRELGLDVNLAPVCDVSTDPGDFMYARTWGKDAQKTADYVAAVVRQSQEGGLGCVLKHFPGYGDNADTHTGIATDERPLAHFQKQDFLPFQAGIAAGAGSVLVSHNIVTCMDGARPASLSPAVHMILREQLGFDGVIMTDDLAMDAIGQYTDGASAAVLALQAGNDMLISSDLETQLTAVLDAVRDGALTEEQIEQACARVLGWKYDLGLLARGNL